MTDSEDWKQVEALFDAAWDLPAASRRDWLNAQRVPTACVEHAQRLLDAVETSGDFLEPAATNADDLVRDSVLAVGDAAGNWRVLRTIGRGGMGEVHEVERADGQFTQQAALKVLLHADAAAWSRFQVERQILAGIDHPGIARIIDGGQLDDGQPYMVMEYVDGTPIDTYCDKHAIDLRGRISLIIEVGTALAHAHGKLVVHRDLKPSNILVDGDRRARLIDFGIARLSDDSLTAIHVAGLSLDYAAPEQAAAGPILTATDIYGLAAVLYQLVSGHAPRDCRDQAVAMALARVRSEAPGRLAEQLGVGRWCDGHHQRALLADLDAVVGKAMQPDPSRRYPTIEAFCSDLRVAMGRGIVQARAHQRRHRIARQAWGQRWGLLAAFAIVASLAIGLAAALWQMREAARQRDQALLEQTRLEAVQYSIFHMFRSAGELKGGEATAADVLGNAAQRIDDEFARDPARGAPVLHALGELYFLLTDYEAARPLLQRLANADPRVVDPALIAAGRYDLAQTVFREGDAGEARRLLEQAQAYWNSDHPRWESRLLDSRLLESQLLRQAGQPDAAIALLEDGLLQRTRLSGANHRETGIFHNNLGVALFGSGELEGARDAFRAARQVWKVNALEQTPDALNTLNNWGTLELADGKVDLARTLLGEAVELRRRYFGPSAATAALLGNYGKLLLQSGQSADALVILREAAAMGENYAGRGSLHHVAAASAAVEAALATGARDAAALSAQATVLAARATLGTDHAGTAMAVLALARVRGEQRRLQEAGTLLAEAERIANLVGGSAGERLVSQVAAIRGRYRLAAGHPAVDAATL